MDEEESTRIYKIDAVHYIVLGCIWPKKDRENVWTILYVCALVTIDFMYEFYAKRALFKNTRSRTGNTSPKKKRIERNC